MVRSLLMISSESRPALSAMILGMTSSDFANMFITSCSLPWMVIEWFLSPFDSSISVAPPPATTVLVLKHRRTIMIASFNDLSASLMNCSAPPRRMMVADLDWISKQVRLGTLRRDCNARLRSDAPRTFHKFQAR